MDKVKNRLEQLDQSEDEQKQTLQVTQKDYVAHIENLHNELIAAWEVEERVKGKKYFLSPHFYTYILFVLRVVWCTSDCLCGFACSGRFTYYYF